MKICNIAVIGAGPAGCMAAIRAAESGKNVVLIERNDSIGKKLMITGKGRCNLTNTASIDTFIKKFGKTGKFFRSAFFTFFNDDLIEFFRAKGLELKAERQGRVFPVTDKSRSVVEVLEKYLAENTVDVLYNTRITGIERKGKYFTLICDNTLNIEAKKVIITTGGASYRATGSTGDGFTVAEEMGHAVIPLKPALVPLKTKEGWVKDLQGLGLENVRLTFRCGDKKITSDVGEAMFTHFGISGPLILDLSGDIVSFLETHKEIHLTIDLKPGLRKEQLESKFVNKFIVKGSIQIKNLMQDILPKRMIPVFLALLKIKSEKLTNQITKEERRSIIDTLKAFPLTVTGSLPIEEAMVTGGGVSVKGIDPRTMESRIIPGLYFAGEVIEGAAPSGGYNLQQAFSTGYLAGQKAAENLN
ncbi:MAG: NAD(P)/FAD-dependent oxidoreductase [Candidatus Omnitrophica bacterium]|nr:NAD(P)/FAD-dependent oxidoreductase [Candidatus Omnitrophota bacterium]